MRINRFIIVTPLCLGLLMVISPPGGADDELLPKRELLLFQKIPVIVTAAKYGQIISEAPASVTIITSEDIERYGYRTLEEILAGVRGFYVSNDRNYSYAGVRGYGRPSDCNNRVLVLVNGHTLNERVYGSVGLGTTFGLDLDSVKRIEIVRGPGSALYGTSAMFAVINVITKEGASADGLKLSGTIGGYGRLQGRAMLGREFDNDVEIFISSLWSDIEGQDLYYEEYDDPSTNDGVAEDMDCDKHRGLLTTITYKDFALQGIATSREKGVPTGAWETLFNDDDAKTLDERGFIELKYSREIGIDKNVMLRGYYDHYTYKGTYPYEDEPNWFDASNNNWLGSELQFRWDHPLDNRLIVGAEYQNHFRADCRYWTVDETYFDGDFPHNILSLYLQDEYSVSESLSLTLGIRRDEYSDSGGSTTPRASIIYNPIKSGTLKLLYGEAFRAPSVYEANYEEIDYWEANPELKPEKIRTMEVIWEHWLSDGLLGTVSLYNYEMNDLVDVVELPDSLFQFQNVSKVKAKGLELELNAQLEMGLRGYVSYTFQDAEDADSKEKLTNSPSHIVKLGLACPVFDYFYAALGLQYETERITVYETKTDPYLLTNINLSTKPLFDHLKFSFLIRNLFDTEYKLPGGFEHMQPAIVQDGRSFAAKLEYNF